MINLYNNRILVTSNDSNIRSIKSYLYRILENPIKVPVGKFKNGKIKYKEVNYIKMYEELDNGDIVLMPGLSIFLEHMDKVKDHRTDNLQIPRVVDVDKYKNMSEVVVLRDDQLEAIRRMYKHRKGIIQLPTGIGKSEIIAGYLKSLIMELGYIPNILILEPTLLLVTGLIERLNSYGIECNQYSDEMRNDISGIVISHPKSINIDLDSNPNLLDEVSIVIGDECQHYQSTTWKNVVKSAKSAEVCIGVSAYVVSEDKLPINNRDLSELAKLSDSEVSVISSTGNVLMYKSPKDYIHAGILATPKLIRINHEADEYVSDPKNWHQVRKNVLESPSRSMKMAVVSGYIATLGYKSLILVSTKKHAYEIMKYIADLGLASRVRCSFGGGTYYRYDEDKGKEVKVKSKEEDTYEEYKRGNINIFIGTSHIYEGADVPNLDAVILSSVGKEPRRVIQGIGRAIRKSKTGRCSYIIDFTDSCNGILRYHSNLRRNICKDMIGVESESIFDGVSLSEFKYIFNSLERL